jgi:hypothetical protein
MKAIVNGIVNSPDEIVAELVATMVGGEVVYHA